MLHRDRGVADERTARLFEQRSAHALQPLGIGSIEHPDRHPGLARHLRDDTGKLRSFVNVYLGDEDIRFLADKDQTALSPGASLIIVPSIAGGAE